MTEMTNLSQYTLKRHLKYNHARPRYSPLPSPVYYDRIIFFSFGFFLSAAVGLFEIFLDAQQEIGAA
ncbi:hypothetical protein Pfo_002083 [Paulownia fortunei]|nr:hypothetical protein Pfo_002083 [Paulownia fortunei]